MTITIKQVILAPAGDWRLRVDHFRQDGIYNRSEADLEPIHFYLHVETIDDDSSFNWIVAACSYETSTTPLNEIVDTWMNTPHGQVEIVREIPDLTRKCRIRTCDQDCNPDKDNDATYHAVNHGTTCQEAQRARLNQVNSSG